MSKSMTIGQLSKAIDLPAKTIRFYEAEGIIASAKRGDNGYRLYDPTAVEELQLIKSARDLGLPLGEIKKLMAGCNGEENCHHTKKYIESEIEEYVGKLRAQITQFQTLEKKLTGLRYQVHQCDESNQKDEYCCNILHQLINPSPLERTRDEKGKT